MQALQRLVNTLLFEQGCDRIMVVVLRDVIHPRLATAPFRVEVLCNRFHSRLIAAAVTDQNDILESMRRKRRTDIRQKMFERLFGHTDRSRILHVARFVRLPLSPR